MRKALVVVAFCVAWSVRASADAFDWDGESWVFDMSAHQEPTPCQAVADVPSSFEWTCGSSESSANRGIDTRCFSWGWSNESGLDCSPLIFFLMLR